MFSVHHSIMSVTSRIAGSIGKHHSFWAMYSLRMSVWIVPPSLLRPARPASRRPARRRRAGSPPAALIVIEVVTPPSGIPSKSRSMSARVSTATPSRPTSPRLRVVVGVVAHQGRHVEGGREPGLAVVEQVVEALVGLLDGAEAGELAHRPQPPPVHRGVGAAGEGIGAGLADPLLGVALEVGLGVERLDLLAGDRRELGLAFGARLVALPPLLGAGVRGANPIRGSQIVGIARTSAPNKAPSPDADERGSLGRRSRRPRRAAPGAPARALELCAGERLGAEAGVVEGLGRLLGDARARAAGSRRGPRGGRSRAARGAPGRPSRGRRSCW